MYDYEINVKMMRKFCSLVFVCDAESYYFVQSTQHVVPMANNIDDRVLGIITLTCISFCSASPQATYSLVLPHPLLLPVLPLVHISFLFLFKSGTSLEPLCCLPSNVFSTASPARLECHQPFL